jgi:threonine dehydratase
VVTNEEVNLFSKKFYEHVIVTPLTTYNGPKQWWQDIQLKDETKQIANSFKFRGNFYRLLEEARDTTVVTSSTGNHGMGMSIAAQMLGLKARVFVPEKISRVKAQAIEDLGATLARVDGGYDECTEEAKRFSAETGAPYISSLDDPLVVRGHSSLFEEINNQYAQKVDIVFVPVGGGGLLAGCLSRFQGTGIKVVGVELEGVPSMKMALETGKRELFPPTSSIAEGMLVRRAGELPFQLAQAYPQLEIVLISDEQIRQAMRLLWEHNHIRAEGAGAASFAAILNYQPALAGQRAVAVISGGNIDEATFQRALAVDSYTYIR